MDAAARREPRAGIRSGRAPRASPMATDRHEACLPFAFTAGPGSQAGSGRSPWRATCGGPL